MTKNKSIDKLKYKISELGLSTINVSNDDLIVVVDKDMYMYANEAYIFVCFGNDIGKIKVYPADDNGITNLIDSIIASSVVCDTIDQDGVMSNVLSDVDIILINGMTIKLYDLIKEYGSLDQIPVTKYQDEQDPVNVEPIVVHNKKEYSKLFLGDNAIEICTYVHKMNNMVYKRNYERVINRKTGDIMSTKVFDVPVAIESNPLLDNTETLSEFRNGYAKLMSDLDQEVYITDVTDKCINSTKKCIISSKRLVNRKVVAAFDNYNYIFIRICETESELDSAMREDETTWYRFRFNHMVMHSAILFVMGGAFITDWLVVVDNKEKIVQLLDSNKVGKTNSHSMQYDFCEFGLKSLFTRYDISDADVQSEMNNCNMVMIMLRQKDGNQPKPYFGDLYYDFPYGYKPQFTQSVLDLNNVYSSKVELNKISNYNNSGNSNNLGGFTMNNDINNAPNTVQANQQDTQNGITQPEPKPENNSDGRVRIVLNKEQENFVDGEMPRTDSGVIDFSALTTGKPLRDVLENNKLENNPEYVAEQQGKQRTVTQSIEVIRNFAIKSEEQKVKADFTHLSDPNYQAETIVNPKFENPGNKQTLINESVFYGAPVNNPFEVTVNDIPVIERIFEKEEKQSRELLSNIKIIDSDGNEIERDTFNIWNSWLLQNGMQPEDLIPDENGDVHLDNIGFNTPPQRTSNSLLMNQHMSKVAAKENIQDDEEPSISNLKDLYIEKNNNQTTTPDSLEVEVQPEPVVEEIDTTVPDIQDETIVDVDDNVYSEEDYDYVVDEESLKNDVEYKSHMAAINKLEKEIAEKGKTTVRARKLKSHVKYIEILKEKHTVAVLKEREVVEQDTVESEKSMNLISVDYIINYIKEVLNSKGIIPTETEWDQVVDIMQRTFDKEDIANYLVEQLASDTEDPIYLEVLENGTPLDGELVFARDMILTHVFGLDLKSINECIVCDENSLAQESIDLIRGVLSMHQINDILSTDEEICDMLLKKNDDNDVMNYIVSIYGTCEDDKYKLLLGYIIANKKVSLGNIIYNKDALLQSIYHFSSERKKKEPEEFQITPEYCLGIASRAIPNLNTQEFAAFISKDVTQEYAYRRFGQIIRKLGKSKDPEFKALRDPRRLREVKMLVLTYDFIDSENI